MTTKSKNGPIKNMTNKLNGYYLVHLHYGKELVVKYVDDVPYGVNIDSIDPVGYEMPMQIVQSQIMAIEPISDARIAYMREISLRRVRVNDIQTILQLKQAIELGQQAGVVSVNQNEPQPEAPAPKPPAKGLSVVRDNQPAVDNAIKNDEKPIEVRSPRILGGGDLLANNDGRVVTIPKPGIR